ncbi:MAG TPA: phosphate ABC transporter permease PtsA [Verrucomicrobia bacterium]|nr:MAG: phosphate ABC transporter, permease protein PstA [Lentisphaerae bacterium GWF2_57_35]HBA83974.1 phosphate ABC transporter permease PtsA [Verrucomicrobiota bacterium]
MRLQTRKILDRTFAGTGVLAIVLMSAALLILLTPIFIRGAGALFFTGTVEHRRLMLEKFDRGNRKQVEAEIRSAQAAREPIYRTIAVFDQQLAHGDAKERAKYKKPLKELKKALQDLLGPAPGSVRPMLMRDQYGQTRWDRAQIKLARVLYREEWDYSNPTKSGVLLLKSRAADFAGTPIQELFSYMEKNLDQLLLPRRTLYWQFLTDESFDSHFFGGIWPELLGTIYLTLGAMLLAIPMGLIAAIYLTEYARESRLLNLLRTCISTLAGVPSIVFGLFGLAFFINTLKVSNSKSVLAGSMTLALMILPTVIRASEEALRSVPRTYKEAALSLGAGRWHTIWNVILPSALPGILTGIVISMGRAAGETAPIIFTAAVSVGKPLALWQTLSQPTPALSWNIYNLATEHEAVDEVRHVQYGLVLVLVSLVLLLNLAAIILRARIAKRMRA